MIQKSFFLFRFLRLRIVVNDRYIYYLTRNKAIPIVMPSNPSRVVITDGYHITQPLEIAYSGRKTYYFKIICAISDDELLVGLIISILVYFMGLLSEVVFMELLSLSPLIYFLFIYYIKRKDFIQIKPA